MMTRREAVVSLAGGAVLLACGEPRAVNREPGPLEALPGEPEKRMFWLAALAASSHNSQPWTVRVKARDRYSVAIDPARRLAAVDPDGREMVLSLGAFLENFSQAARALGREAAVDSISSHRDSPSLFEIALAPRRAEEGNAVERIESRRTQRKNLRDETVPAADLQALLAAAGTSAFYPAGSGKARWIAEAAIESNRQQTWRDDAQAELARWIRFSREEIERRRDGLTPGTMEIGGLGGFYARHFMDAGTVMGKSFRQAGIDLVVEQARQGAGFLVIGAPDESVANLLDAGRRYQRLALLLRERKLAGHPMSQLLEEEPWRSQATKETLGSGVAQFVVRIGSVDDRPLPVSPRRPLSSFVQSG